MNVMYFFKEYLQEKASVISWNSAGKQTNVFKKFYEEVTLSRT